MNDDTQSGGTDSTISQGSAITEEFAEELESLRLDPEVGEAGYGNVPAVLVVGCQRAFTDPESPLGGDLGSTLRAIRRLTAAARRVAIPVLFSVRHHGEDPEADLLLRKRPALAALVPGAPLAELDARLVPECGEPIFEASGASAFHGTQLAAWLADLGVDTVVMAGCMASDGLRATAAEAAQGGWRVQIPRDCVGDRHGEEVRSGLIDIQRMYGDVVEIGETLAFFERAHIESMIKVLE